MEEQQNLEAVGAEVAEMMECLHHMEVLHCTAVAAVAMVDICLRPASFPHHAAEAHPGYTSMAPSTSLHVVAERYLAEMGPMRSMHMQGVVAVLEVLLIMLEQHHLEEMVDFREAAEAAAELELLPVGQEVLEDTAARS